MKGNENMTDELKTCPFCGGLMFYFETKPEAKEAWNARPIENELNEKIGKLEEENTRLQRKLNESIDDNYKNAWKIQQQAFRGMKYAQKENKRLREALELIEKSKFYFARGEEDKQLRRVCEIAKDALKEVNSKKEFKE